MQVTLRENKIQLSGKKHAYHLLWNMFSEAQGAQNPMSFVKRKNGEIIQLHSSFKKILDTASQRLDGVFRDEDLFPDTLVEDFRRTDHHALSRGLLYTRPEFIGNSHFHGWHLTAKVKATAQGGEPLIFGITQPILSWNQRTSLSLFCPPRLAPIISFIEQHYHLGLQSKQLAAHFGLSSTGLEKLFKIHYGITPLHFIRRYRVFRAGLDIQASSPHSTLAEIAHRHGFAAPSHLSTEFKKFTGLTPNSCRP